MGRFQINVKNSILKQPEVRYIPPETLGIQFDIDFSKCNSDDEDTVDFLRTVLPNTDNIVAVNASMFWKVMGKKLRLKLYTPRKDIVEYLENVQLPVGIQKKEILRKEESLYD